METTWNMNKKAILALAAELVRGAECMGDDDTELTLEVRMPGTVRDDDGNLNIGPVLAISYAEYPEEGVYPIDPHDPTAGREPEAQQQAEAVAMPAAGWRPVPIRSLQNLLCLIDPAPVNLPNSKVMVFKNPNAADMLTRISAEVRAMLAATPQSDEVFMCWGKESHEWWLSHVAKQGGTP